MKIITSIPVTGESFYNRVDTLETIKDRIEKDIELPTIKEIKKVYDNGNLVLSQGYSE